MIIDRCQPLNSGEQDTVRVTMCRDEAVRLVVRGGHLLADEIETLVRQVGVATVIRELLSDGQSRAVSQIVNQTRLPWGLIDVGLRQLIDRGEVRTFTVQDDPFERFMRK